METVVEIILRDGPRKTIREYAKEYNVDNKKLSDYLRGALGMPYTEYKRQHSGHMVAPRPASTTSVPWSELYLGAASLAALKELCSRLYAGDFYDIEYFDDIDTLDRIKALQFSDNTKLRLMMALCSAMDVTAGKHINKYILYEAELRFEMTRRRMERVVPDFIDIYDYARAINTKDQFLLVLAALIMNARDNMNIGILRPSDIVQTRLHPCADHSYLCGTRWFIHEDDTKNGTSRELTLSEEFAEVLNIISENNKEYLVEQSNGAPYTDISALSILVTKTFKCHFNDIRAANFTWRERQATTHAARMTLRMMCYFEGHSYTTAMTNYLGHETYRLSAPPAIIEPTLPAPTAKAPKAKKAPKVELHSALDDLNLAPPPPEIASSDDLFSGELKIVDIL